MAQKTFNTADICEAAHYLTVRDCKREKITLNCHKGKCTHDGEGEVHYSTKAQEIFDKHFDIIEEQYESNPNITREE